MANPRELMQIANDQNFQNRVKYYMQKAGIAVMTEANTTPNHTERVTYANKVLDGTASVFEQAVGVTTNATIAAEANAATQPDWGIQDSNIEFQVNAQYNAYASIAT